MRGIAARHLSKESSGCTFNPTDLVHEAFLRLNEIRTPIMDRLHFLRLASTQMRRVLVDHARRKSAIKRGQRARQVTLRSTDESGADIGIQIVELDLLLSALGKSDPRKARLAELHYFGGYTQDEMAATLGISAATVVRDLRFLRSWIQAELGPTTAAGEICGVDHD